MKRAVASRALNDFMLALGRATLTGDVATVVLEHSVALLGASTARLVIDQGDHRRCWTLAEGDIRVDSFAGRDATSAGSTPAAGTGSAVTTRHEEIRADGSTGQALIAERTEDGDRLMLAVGRWGRRPFDQHARSLLESLLTFTDVALQNMQLLGQLQQKAEALEHLATHDHLTGLANRRRFHDETEQAVAEGRAGAILLVDLDRFKEVNDTLGHHTGDELLIEVASRLRHAVGDAGLIARLGGDEFAVLLRPATGADLRAWARRIHAALEGPAELCDVAVDVGASIGVAVPSVEHRSVSTLLRQADVAMYAAKSARTGVEVYEPDLDHYRPEALALVPRFRGAVEQGDLHVAFQPQFDTATDRVIGAEALARWSPPGVGPVPPSQFIPIAESTGLIRQLTQQVLVEAVAECTRWQGLDHDVRVSVNIAPRVLLDPGFADRISDLLAEAGLPPRLLRLEVTESTVMTDPDRAAAVLRNLAERGMSVAIDDFGTGHSSLAYLTSLPCHEIKIDRSFVTALEHSDPRAVAVVASIIGLGRDLGIDVIAEGVETERAAEQLQRLGCRVAQGFLYGRPVRATELRRVLGGQVGSPAVMARPSGLEVPVGAFIAV